MIYCTILTDKSIEKLSELNVDNQDTNEFNKILSFIQKLKEVEPIRSIHMDCDSLWEINTHLNSLV